MKSRALVNLSGTALLSGVVCFAQAKPDVIQDRFENVDFGAGKIGGMPPGWRLGPEGTQVYTVETADGASCNGAKQCGSVRSVGLEPHRLSFLYQVVDAKPYRGNRFTFRADVRADVNGASVARLLVRIHREDGSTSFRDDMGSNPITSGPWRTFEIAAPIASDARDIEFGMQLVGEGSASIDNISLVFGYPQNKSNDPDVRALIRKFADFRNAHEGAGVAALYSESGEWFGQSGRVVRGQKALSTLWGDLPGNVERSVESVEFLGGNIALVRVTTQYAEPIGRHHESFIVVEENEAWYIRAHKSLD